MGTGVRFACITHGGPRSRGSARDPDVEVALNPACGGGEEESNSATDSGDRGGCSHNQYHVTILDPCNANRKTACIGLKCSRCVYDAGEHPSHRARRPLGQ